MKETGNRMRSKPQTKKIFAKIYLLKDSYSKCKKKISYSSIIRKQTAWLKMVKRPEQKPHQKR